MLWFFGLALPPLTNNELGAGAGVGEMATRPEAAAPDDRREHTAARRFEGAETQLDAEALLLADRKKTLNMAEAEELAERLAAFETAQEDLEQTLALSEHQTSERDSPG